MDSKDTIIRSLNDPPRRSNMFSLLRQLGGFLLTERQREITVSASTALRYSINLVLSEVAIVLHRAFPVSIWKRRASYYQWKSSWRRETGKNLESLPTIYKICNKQIIKNYLPRFLQNLLNSRRIIFYLHQRWFRNLRIFYVILPLKQGHFLPISCLKLVFRISLSGMVAFRIDVLPIFHRVFEADQSFELVSGLSFLFNMRF